MISETISSILRYLAIKFHEMEEKLQNERNRNRISDEDDVDSNTETSTMESIPTTQDSTQTNDASSTVSDVSKIS